MKKKIRDKNGNFINYRRRQAIFRKFMLFITLIILSTGLAFAAGKLASNAQNITDVQYYKYHKSITVSEGETLSSLTVKYGDHFDSKKEFINEVIYTNHLTDDVLYVGMNLIVPYYSTEFVK